MSANWDYNNYTDLNEVDVEITLECKMLCGKGELKSLASIERCLRSQTHS